MLKPHPTRERGARRGRTVRAPMPRAGHRATYLCPGCRERTAAEASHSHAGLWSTHSSQLTVHTATPDTEREDGPTRAACSAKCAAGASCPAGRIRRGKEGGGVRS
eukprot:366228-Chlamydomonas_euryale.AAC.5